MESGVRRAVVVRDDLHEWLEANVSGYCEMGHENCATDDSNRVIAFSNGRPSPVRNVAYSWSFVIGFAEERDAALFKVFWL